MTAVRSWHTLCYRQLPPNIIKMKWLTLRSQKVWIKAQEVGAEVEPALAGHFSFPVAAWVICDQLFLWWQLKPLLEPQECFSELLRILLQHQGRLPFLSNKTLKHSCCCRLRNVTEQTNMSSKLFIYSYSNLALYKTGDVFAGVKNRERPHDVLLQPVPVLNDLLFGDTWTNIRSKENIARTQLSYHVRAVFLFL